MLLRLTFLPKPLKHSSVFALVALLIVALNTAFAPSALAETKDETLKRLELELSEINQGLDEKQKRLDEVNQDITDLESNIKDIDSRALPLKIEKRKLDLEFKKIDVKKNSDRSADEIAKLSKIKYRQHIIKLKISLEEDAKNTKLSEIKTLNDRQVRLERVLKKLSRQKRGYENEIAELQDSPDTPVIVQAPKAKAAPAAKKTTAPVVTPTAPAALATPNKETKPDKAEVAELNKATEKALAKASNQENITTEESNSEKKEETKPRVLASTPSVFSTQDLNEEQLEKRRRSLALLSTMNNIPESSKAVIRAQTRALEAQIEHPNLGNSTNLELTFGEDKAPAIAQLNHIGNHQYLVTITIESGYQQFHIGAMKFTKRIDEMYHNKQAVIILDAKDLEKPIFEVHPVTLEKPEYFTF